MEKPAVTRDTDALSPDGRLKRRGLIAAAAALAASVAASNPVSAQVTDTFMNGLRVRRGGYTTPVDDRPDAIQGYTVGAHNAGIAGRNDSTDGVGLIGVATNGTGIYGQSEGGTGVFGRATGGRGLGRV